MKIRKMNIIAVLLQDISIKWKTSNFKIIRKFLDVSTKTDKNMDSLLIAPSLLLK